MKRYKIIYCWGDDIGLRTKVSSGHAWVADGILCLQEKGKQEPSPMASLQSAELFRPHGMGRMIRAQFADRPLLNIAVVRFSLFGQFALINFFGTGKLCEELCAMGAGR